MGCLSVLDFPHDQDTTLQVLLDDRIFKNFGRAFRRLVFSSRPVGCRTLPPVIHPGCPSRCDQTVCGLVMEKQFLRCMDSHCPRARPLRASRLLLGRWRGTDDAVEIRTGRESEVPRDGRAGISSKHAEGPGWRAKNVTMSSPQPLPMDFKPPCRLKHSLSTMRKNAAGT